MKYVSLVVLATLVTAGVCRGEWTENIVDDFDTFTFVPDVGEVGDGWTVLDFGPQSVYPAGPTYEFDFSKDDRVVGQTITTGPNGICDTFAQEDDVYEILPFHGLANAVCISAGGNGVLDTSPGGDDQVSGDAITTGSDGVCDTTASGDDVQVIPVGQGEPDAVCISAGPNGTLDTDNMPNVWAEKVPGQNGGWAQRITVIRGTRCLVKTFPVTPGQDYVISMKVRYDQLGARPRTGGIMGWGYDATGQTTDPTPKGPEPSSTGTVIYNTIYNQPDNNAWSDIDQAVAQGWVNTYETFTATGDTVSVWVVVDDQDRYLRDGFQMTVDHVAITPYTPDPGNKLWNSDLEIRSSARQEVPAGFYPKEWYWDDEQFPLEEDGTLKEECSLDTVGHQVFSGEWSAAGGRYDDSLWCGGGGLTFLARDLKENTDYVLRVKIYETIRNRPTDNIGPQGGVFVRCNVRGDLARQDPEDFNYGYWPYGIGYYDDINYQDWSYPYQGRGWWEFEYTIHTGDYQPGVNDERVEVSIWGWNGKMRTITYFDDITLVEAGEDPFIQISDVSQLLSVPPSGEVTITWTTDAPSTSQVDYGTTEALGSTTGVVETGVTSHSVTVSGLDPSEDFYYRVVSTAPDRITAYSRQHRVLAAEDTVVNGGFEDGFYSRIRQAVIVTGYDGVCDTVAAAGDVQEIPVGQGMPDTVCITKGDNGVLETTPSGDDQVVGDTITTGADGICDTACSGDDVQHIQVGRGAPDRVCVSAGPDAVISTLRLGDDRSTEDMRPVGWHYWGYSFGLLPGFQREGSDHVVRWMGRDANGAMYGFDGQEAASFKGAGETHSGDHSFGLWECVSNHGEVGGACQTVKTVPGEDYSLSVWLRGYDDFLSYTEMQSWENVATQIGVDPLGGSDPTSPSVIWNDKVFYGAADDVQVIPVGQGLPYALAIGPGGNGVLDSTPGGDDTVDGDTITTGANGVCESDALGDDMQWLFPGEGEPDAVCITAGPDGILSSTYGEYGDDEIVGDTITTGWDGICDSVAVNNADATHRYNEMWYNETLDFTAQSDRATIFLAGHVHSGATFGPLQRHMVWFDDVTLTGPPPTYTWEDAQVGWNLMSLPAVPDDPDPEAVFADLTAAGNVIPTSLYRYSKASGYELYPSASFTAMEVGRGYWLQLYVAADNTFAGTPPESPYTLPLDEGWTMFGHPFPTPVSWDSVHVTDGVEVKTMAEAVAAGWIQPQIYYYEPGSGYLIVEPGGGAGHDALEPWRGYWCLAYRAGLSLVIER